MAEVDEKKAQDALEIAGTGASRDSIEASTGGADPAVEVVGVTESLGTEKYVFAAFFAAGIGVAFIVGKILAAAWSHLAEAPWAVKAVPQLLRYAEEERPTYTMTIGAVVGLIAVILCLRSDRLRGWADDVALELSKVTWPKRETVTNGTIVVIAAGIFATIYIGLLDRLWGFVTHLVYGA
jgi:preprotein translocase subunit SecE